MSKNILVVQYTPRGERSKTKELLDSLTAKIGQENTVTTVDLTEDVPSLLLKDNLAAYLDRDYAHQVLSADRASLLSQNDRFIKQIQDCDVLVLAFPMYNFSQPAAVKAYFDAILLKGHTWDMNEKGFVGLLASGKKAIVITTTGGDYSAAPMVDYDHVTSLTTQHLQFMGFSEVKHVSANALNMTPDSTTIMDNAKQQLATLATDILA